MNRENNNTFEGAAAACADAIKSQKTEFDMTYLWRYKTERKALKKLARTAVLYLEGQFPGIILQADISSEDAIIVSITTRKQQIYIRPRRKRRGNYYHNN